MTSIEQEVEVARRFDRLSDRFKSVVDEHDFRLEAITLAIGPVRGLRILDLGCGQGRFAIKLLDAGARVIGVDRSLGMLTRAAQPVPRVQASAGRLPFSTGSFDVVLAIEVLEHIDRIEPILIEAARCLKPGGVFLAIDKNAGCLNAKRPWLPGLAVKWLDERRGLWMYPAGGPVRERWFWPSRLCNQLRKHFDAVGARYLESPDESAQVFHTFPATRRFVLWSGRARGGFL